MKRIKYYSIIPSISSKAPSSVVVLEARDELYLSPNLKLCSVNRMAHIESESLALSFAEMCTSKIQKRYGNDASLEVITCEASENQKLIDRIKADSEVVKKRIETNNFSPNKAP